jgi:hypothetical protein
MIYPYDYDWVFVCFTVSISQRRNASRIVVVACNVCRRKMELQCRSGSVPVTLMHRRGRWKENNATASVDTITMMISVIHRSM